MRYGPQMITPRPGDRIEHWLLSDDSPFARRMGAAEPRRGTVTQSLRAIQRAEPPGTLIPSASFNAFSEP